MQNFFWCPNFWGGEGGDGRPGWDRMIPSFFPTKIQIEGSLDAQIIKEKLQKPRLGDDGDVKERHGWDPSALCDHHGNLGEPHLKTYLMSSQLGYLLPCKFMSNVLEKYSIFQRYNSFYLDFLSEFSS